MFDDDQLRTTLVCLWSCIKTRSKVRLGLSLLEGRVEIRCGQGDLCVLKLTHNLVHVCKVQHKSWKTHLHDNKTQDVNVKRTQNLG